MYNCNEIEQKWQKYWKKNKTFKTENDFSKPKYYTLDMFPYPSGVGLHVGHPKGFVGNDIYSRYKKTKGFNVLHPMGWDAFGLPAENYAIKTGTHPRTTTDKNIENYKKQLDMLGLSYDWDRAVDTTDPKYYKWTQWIFLKLFEKGLAYEQDLPINYCPSCKTGLANEEVLNDFSCERCGTKVEKKKIRQWVLAITKYADRLLKDVDKLDWPEGIKDMQRNWIGKSEGCEFEMKKLGNDNKSIKVYTTRIDTVFGMTYAVVAPDHPNINDFIEPLHKKQCIEYIENAGKKSDQDRTQDDKEKTGIFTGTYVINPFNGKQVQLWIGDYVLGNYGTGAVMAVPAHDTRDFDFAKKYKLEIIESISNGKNDNGYTYEKAFTNLGTLVNSGDFDGLSSKEAQKELIKFSTKNGFGEKKINYKLRDWLFSRQRYWGEPIPLIHLDITQLKNLTHISNISEASDNNLAYILKRPPVNGESSCDSTTCSGMVRELIIGGKVFSKIYDGIYGKIICDYNLPLKLPKVENYKPSGDGKSPLNKVEDFVNIKLADNLVAKRETNTMPQWGGSCWYYLRYMNPDNIDKLVDPEVEKYWGQVDSYVGGSEHAVLHLLYARFWHKFLFDIGVVSNDEPFKRLKNQGLIQSHVYDTNKGQSIHMDLIEEKDGKYYHKETKEQLEKKIGKMSKSLGNVVNPDDIVEEYGADSFRLYEMYLSDFKDAAPWNTTGILGVKRFLEKSERLFGKEAKISTQDDNFTIKLLNKTIKKVEEDIENYKFNTAISSLMILVNNGLPNTLELQSIWKKTFIVLLHPFAPYLSEELWEKIGNTSSVFFSSWPEYDDKLIIDNNIKIAIQVLGKVRATIEINKDESKDSVLQKAKQNPNILKWIEGKKLIKEIYIPGKIVNLVVK